MTHSVNFEFAPNDVVRLKEAPHRTGKVIALLVDRNGAKAAHVRFLEEGRFRAEQLDECDLEAVPAEAKPVEAAKPADTTKAPEPAKAPEAAKPAAAGSGTAAQTAEKK